MLPDRTGWHQGNQAGFALVAVLVFMLLAAAVIAPFAIAARTQLMITSNETERLRLSILAEGLTNVVAVRLAAGEQSVSVLGRSEPYNCQAGVYTFTISMQDHAGLIDLNAASDAQLSVGLVALGLERDAAQTLAATIVTSRSAASPFSSALSPTEDGKHAPFESVSELQDLPGLSNLPLTELQDTFTIFSRQGLLRTDLAPKRLRELMEDQPETDNTPNDGVRTMPFTIDVLVARYGSPVMGHSGYVVERAPTLPGGIKRLSKISPRETADQTVAPGRLDGCDRFFGAEVASLLKAWS